MHLLIRLKQIDNILHDIKAGCEHVNNIFYDIKVSREDENNILYDITASSEHVNNILYDIQVLHSFDSCGIPGGIFLLILSFFVHK